MTIRCGGLVAIRVCSIRRLADEARRLTVDAAVVGELLAQVHHDGAGIAGDRRDLQCAECRTAEIQKDSTVRQRLCVYRCDPGFAPGPLGVTV